MARLQDFPTVTPTSADKLLVVQSQSQGLVPYGSKLDSANPTGTGSLSLNRKANTTTGTNSVVIGYNNEASGNRSVALGNQTTATGYGDLAEGSGTTASGGYGAHAEGRDATASGASSHSEGYNTTASGNYSHAENRGSVASGSYSHASGYGTIANHESQFAFGEYNIADPSSADSSNRGNYVEIVGKGSNDANRSNARTLDWSGNETIAGTLTQSSDAKLKDIINEELPDVSAIKAVRFTWKEDANRDDSEHIGYLAQDVEKVLPFLVKEDAEGNKVLDYIAFLVAKVDSLEKRIAELEG